MPLFDTVLLTASSEAQARAFRALLERRLAHGLYPRELQFEVVADPDGGRIGTGGSTLWALHTLLQRRGRDADALFSRERLLIVHAGGESRRLPCYAPEGKVLSPLPVASSALLPPVVLDAQLALFCRYPWRQGEVVVSSGDVVIDFDTTDVPAARAAVFGFAKPAPPEQGAHHGVFRFDARRERVVDYFQKAPAERLTREALIEGTGDCALDIGLVSLAPAAVRAFLALGASPLDGATVLDALAGGRLRFDLYLEVLTACLEDVSFEGFWGRVRDASALPCALARRVYDAFHPLGLGGTLTRATLFEHVGSLRELPASAAALLAQRVAPFYEADGGEIRPQLSSRGVLQNCVHVTVEAAGSRPWLVEGCERCALRLEGDNVVVGLSDMPLPFVLPAGFTLDGRRLPEGQAVVVLASGDSLKRQRDPACVAFCGERLDEWLAARGLTREDVFAGTEAGDLYEARLFALDPSPSFLRGYLEPPGPAWTAQFRAARRLSLAEINERDDAVRRDDRRLALRRALLRESFRLRQGWREVSLRDFASTFCGPEWRAPLGDWLAQTDDALLRLYRERLYRAVATAPGPALPATIDYVPRADGAPLALALKQDQIVWARAPVRLDLAGGWTDTPPYTLREGGRVVNLAVNLNGQPPIQVFCRPTCERQLRVHSIDLGHSETFTRFDELLEYRDPASPFALPKAALCLLGIDGARKARQTLPQVLDELGCGIEVTLLCAVPKGSGLGTSSVLGGVILAALSRFFGRPLEMELLMRQVLQLEQMLTTGGGWQDQIGGLAGGVKSVESRPGLRPCPVIHQLDPFLFQDALSLSCFTLFYTGLTRLAKNILAEVVDRVNGAEKAYLFTLRHMARLALDAKDAIERRDRAALGEVLTLSWAANKRVHPSTTNPEIEEMLAATRAHVRGAKLLGAGGGGYALLLSPSPRDAAAVRDILSRRFENDRARLVDFSLSTCGLEVSVS